MWQAHGANTMRYWGNKAVKAACYYEYDTVYELNKGLMFIKDVSIGDFVFDGVDYTKVYFIIKFDNEFSTNMLEIKYGNPSNDESIILTSSHLLYKQNENIPTKSGNIAIGDVLSGLRNTTDLYSATVNYT